MAKFGVQFPQPSKYLGIFAETHMAAVSRRLFSVFVASLEVEYDFFINVFLSYIIAK